MKRPLTFLVIEDSSDDAIFFLQALKKMGESCPVQIVSDGWQAVAYLSGEGQYADRGKYPFPNVIFCDLNLPKLGGNEVIRYLRANPDRAATPVIVFSGSENPADIKTAYSLGAHAYILKPRDLDGMEKILRATYDFWALCEKPPCPT